MKTALCALLIIAAAALAACGESADDYNARARNVADSIAKFSAYSELLCSGYESTWAEAIQSSYKDFNKELAAKKESYTEQGVIALVVKGKLWIDSSMKLLNQPPEQSAPSHAKLMEFYGQYSKIHDLAVDPSGSLMSYRQQINTISSDLTKLKSELNVMGLLTVEKAPTP